MINELTVDGQVKKDIEVFEDKIAFVVSIPTHKDELTGKDVFTFILASYKKLIFLFRRISRLFRAKEACHLLKIRSLTSDSLWY